jgi:predicted aspartyl protease/Tfp pilus assembly protein PilF
MIAVASAAATLTMVGQACQAATDPPACKLALAAELKVNVDGLRAYLPTKINGKDAVFLVDSGAFFSTVDSDNATRLGLRKSQLPLDMIVGGVGGDAGGWVGSADTFQVARATFPNVQFVVVPQSIDSDSVGLLGQNVLNVNDIEYDLANGVIRLFKPTDCSGRMLAYWAEETGAGVINIAAMSNGAPHINGVAKVNGNSVRAMFDTGASFTVLTLAAARRLGFRKDGAGVTDGGMVGGLGRSRSQSWIAPFESFTLGDEQVQKTRLRVADFDLGDADMLIGADFFLSHRIYVARSQRKLYFTYNGGPVFRLDRTDSPSGASAGAEPVDAAGYSRRASAQVQRGKFDDAIKDFSRAVDMQPAEPLHYYDRALTYAAAKQDDLALADLDRAIKLRPEHAKALTARGELRLKRKEMDLARADFDAAIRAAGDKDDVRREIASAYAADGHVDAALAHLDSWIAAHPTAVDISGALNDRCWTRALGDRELDKALADCNQAIKARGGRSSALLDSRGLVYLRMGQFDRAIDDYDDALKLQPKQAWSLYTRGLAKLGKGLTAEGKADIAAAVALRKDVAEEAARYGLKP